MSDRNLRVGRVLRASSRGFVIGCRVMTPDIPAFGSFVRADGLAPGSAIYGLIYDVSVEDDPFVRQFIGADPPDEIIQDQRENRQVPIEVSVLAVGVGQGLGSNDETVRHRLPAQPPVTLDWLYQCSDEEVQAFTARLDYFRLVLEARDAPADELLATSLRAGAAARPEREREDFLVGAGRELARLLAGDPVRLEGLLRRLRSEETP
ncbi:MAG: hypothetical protein DRJ03_12515 [Chloroflexi bacterium]|nr:MAG: hypothetical protein B6I35_05575 [Anaerolineaceae bacterium 4572_32.2]RLC85123.1 MAG: hypothetical protein DRJ03_12515 [Chloroflexota bacterium]HEY72407.1 hypothetical protein [Thermoflexia bacterium]